MDVERVLEDSEDEAKTYGSLSPDLENPNKCLSVEDFPCSHLDGNISICGPFILQYAFMHQMEYDCVL